MAKFLEFHIDCMHLVMPVVEAVEHKDATLQRMDAFKHCL
jgi:hypothetical protein